MSAPAEVSARLDAGAAPGSERLPRYERERVLGRVAELLAEHREELSRLISLESGLCLKDSRHEISRAVDVFRFAAMEALRDDGESFPGGHVGLPSSLKSSGLCGNEAASSARNGTTSGSSRLRENAL